LYGQKVRNARRTEFPFIVSIIRIPNPSNALLPNHICTGTLITRRDVVTCEHCIVDERIQRVRIIVGILDVREGVRHKALWWMTYDNWAAQNTQSELENNDLCNIRVNY
jgi:secreted trypsin-like serine protease